MGYRSFIGKHILYGWHLNWEALNYSLIVVQCVFFSTNACGGILDFESFSLRLSNENAILHTIAFKKTVRVIQ